MTVDRDLERLLDTWLADGPSVAPDRVLDAVADRIDRQGQRPAWRLQPWRFPTMSTPLRFAVAVGALFVAALAGGLLFLGGGGQSPTRTPSSTPIASSPPASAFACAGDTLGCAGPLAAGNHASVHFARPFQFQVPNGWLNVRDIPRTYGLEAAGVTDVSVTPIQVMTMIAIADQQSTRCDPIAKSGVGSSVDQLIAYVQSHPGLVASAPVSVTLDGYRGRQIDFSVAPSWNRICEGLDAFHPAVLMLTDTGTPPGRTIAYTSDQHVRWIVLDVAGETVIVEFTSSSFSPDFAGMVRPAEQVADTIHFVPHP